jgi:hypothetical protein
MALIQLLALALAARILLFLLYQSSERIKQAGHEFRRLVRFSSDLAETTKPAVLGAFVARHLAEATGIDDCDIYALDAQTHRLGPFGSHPPEQALAVGPETLEERPILGRVLRDRVRIIVDITDPQAGCR